jgi:deoxyribodipyrimidine photolyase-related protein
MSRRALLLYPYQLYSIDLLPKDVDEVVLVEEPLLFGTDYQHRMYIHKQKLVFFRATMRRYMKEELWPAGFEVDYIEEGHINETEDVVEKLKEFSEVLMFELNDDILARRLMTAIEDHPEGPEVTILRNPNFFLSVEDCNSYFKSNEDKGFMDFYQWQRERFNILINPTTYKPLEGKWGVETKSKKLPKNAHPPTFRVFGSNEFVDEARKYVDKNFPDNPGSTTDFPWPTSRKEALEWLDEFLDNRLEKYGDYLDSIEESVPWMYHSAISPVLNNGFLQPYEIVDRTLLAAEQNKLSPQTIEPFIRNIVGWREYIRALYRKQNAKLRTANSYGHSRRMTHDWYNGTTGLAPVDHAINKVKARSYTHESERNSLLGSVMFMCEFHPGEIYRWYMEMFIDAYDWMVVPYVYGLSQDAAGLSDAHPGIDDSEYILSVSHYEKGEWSDVWDGLYYRAVEKHKERFKKNPGMKNSVKKLALLNENRRRIIGYRAKDFLKAKTITQDHPIKP